MGLATAGTVLGEELLPEHDTRGTVLGDPCDSGGETGGEQERSFACGESFSQDTTPPLCRPPAPGTVRGPGAIPFRTGGTAGLPTVCDGGVRGFSRSVCCAVSNFFSARPPVRSGGVLALVEFSD